MPDPGRGQENALSLFGYLMLEVAQPVNGEVGIFRTPGNIPGASRPIFFDTICEAKPAAPGLFFAGYSNYGEAALRGPAGGPLHARAGRMHAAVLG